MTALWRSRRLQAALAVGACFVVATACKQERIEIRDETLNDYHRADVRAAVDAYVAKGRTATAYAVMAGQFSMMRSTMDVTVANDAELKLVTLALAPTVAASNLPPAREIKELATSVWPVGLQDPLRADSLQARRESKDAKLIPLAYEEPDAYLLRICGDGLKAECYSVVSEYQADVVRHLAMQRFTERVRAAVSDCVLCANDPHWREYVRKWEGLEAATIDRRRRAERLGDPIRWPTAGRASQPMVAPAKAMTLELGSSGELTVEEQRISLVDRVERLRVLRGDREVLLHALPSTRLADLRAVIADAMKAGARRIGLVTRRAVYPWEPRVYWVALTSGTKLPVRPGDSLQVLIATLDEMPAGTELARID